MRGYYRNKSTRVLDGAEVEITNEGWGVIMPTPVYLKLTRRSRRRWRGKGVDPVAEAWASGWRQ